MARWHDAWHMGCTTGVPKSRDDALKWFHAAADKGQKSAIAKLAELEGK